jgi:hypothetical protein
VRGLEKVGKQSGLTLERIDLDFEPEQAAALD